MLVDHYGEILTHNKVGVKANGKPKYDKITYSVLDRGYKNFQKQKDAEIMNEIECAIEIEDKYKVKKIGKCWFWYWFLFLS